MKNLVFETYCEIVRQGSRNILFFQKYHTFYAGKWENITKIIFIFIFYKSYQFNDHLCFLFPKYLEEIQTKR